MTLEENIKETIGATNLHVCCPDDTHAQVAEMQTPLSIRGRTKPERERSL